MKTIWRNEVAVVHRRGNSVMVHRSRVSLHGRQSFPPVSHHSKPHGWRCTTKPLCGNLLWEPSRGTVDPRQYSSARCWKCTEDTVSGTGYGAGSRIRGVVLGTVLEVVYRKWDWVLCWKSYTGSGTAYCAGCTEYGPTTITAVLYGPAIRTVP
jgi:hypothetical protein